MNNKNPPFNPGDIVRNRATGDEKKVINSNYTSPFRWKVYLDNGSWAWDINLDLVAPAVPVDNWPVGYCENTSHFSVEHPLNTSSDNCCINFVSSERLLEIKQLFDAADEIETLTYERDKALDEVERVTHNNFVYSKVIELEWREAAYSSSAKAETSTDSGSVRIWQVNNNGELMLHGRNVFNNSMTPDQAKVLAQRLENVLNMPKGE